MQSEEGLTSAQEAADLVEAHDKLILHRAKVKHEKRNERLIKEGKAAKPFEGIISKDGFVVINMKPIVHNLPEDKPPTRKVFTFSGIQSSKGVSYDRATDKVYNNVYPDRPKTSGLVIPKSLRRVEDRPPSQLKTKRHRKKRMSKLEDFKKKFKKLERVKSQRQDWHKMEENGEVDKRWYKTPKKRKNKKREPKTPAKKQAKRKVSKKMRKPKVRKSPKKVVRRKTTKRKLKKGKRR